MNYYQNQQQSAITTSLINAGVQVGVWYSDDGPPDPSMGNSNDLYFDKVNVLYYFKTTIILFDQVSRQYVNVNYWGTPAVGGYGYWTYQTGGDVAVGEDYTTPVSNLSIGVATHNTRNYGKYISSIVSKSRHYIKQRVAPLILSKPIHNDGASTKSLTFSSLKHKKTSIIRTPSFLNFIYLKGLLANNLVGKISFGRHNITSSVPLTFLRQAIYQIPKLQSVLIRAVSGHPFNAPWYVITRFLNVSSISYPIKIWNYNPTKILVPNVSVKSYNSTSISESYYHNTIRNITVKKYISYALSQLGLTFNQLLFVNKQFHTYTFTFDVVHYEMMPGRVGTNDSYLSDFGHTLIQPFFVLEPRMSTMTIVRLSASLQYQHIDTINNPTPFAMLPKLLSRNDIYVLPYIDRNIVEPSSQVSKMNSMFTAPYLPSIKFTPSKHMPVYRVIRTLNSMSLTTSYPYTTYSNKIWSDGFRIDTVFNVENRYPPAIHWIDGSPGVGVWEQRTDNNGNPLPDYYTDNCGISPLQYLTTDLQTDLLWTIGGDSLLNFTIQYTWTVVTAGASGVAQIVMTSRDYYENYEFGSADFTNISEPRYYDANPDWVYVPSPIDPISNTPITITDQNTINIGTSGVTITPTFGNDDLVVGMQWQIILGTKDTAVLYPAPYGRIGWWQPITTMAGILMLLPTESYKRNISVTSQGRISG